MEARAVRAVQGGPGLPGAGRPGARSARDKLRWYVLVEARPASGITVPGRLGIRHSLDSPAFGGRAAVGGQLVAASTAAPIREHWFGDPDTIVGLPEALQYPFGLFSYYRQYLMDRGSFPSARQFGRYLSEVHRVHHRDGSALNELHLRALLPALKVRYMGA